MIADLSCLLCPKELVKVRSTKKVNAMETRSVIIMACNVSGLCCCAGRLKFHQPGNESPIELQSTKVIQMLIRERSRWTEADKRFVADVCSFSQHSSKPMLPAHPFSV